MQHATQPIKGKLGIGRVSKGARRKKTEDWDSWQSSAAGSSLQFLNFFSFSIDLY